MARLMTGGSSQELHATAPVTGVAFTASVFVKTAGSSDALTFALADNSAATHYFLLYLRNSTGQGAMQTRAGGAPEILDTGNSFSTGVWQHLCGIWSSNTSRRLILNGDWANSATGTTNLTPAGIDIMSFGAMLDSSPSYCSNDCDIGSGALWDTSLNQVDVEALADGVCPLFIQPNNLIGWWEIFGVTDPEIDRIGGANLTLTNSPTKSAHHGIIYRTRRKLFPFTAAAASTIESLGGLHHIGMGMGDPGVARLPQTLHTIDRGIAL